MHKYKFSVLVYPEIVMLKLPPIIGDVFASYEYDNETVPFADHGSESYHNVIPEITMDLAQLPIYAKSRKLAAYWGFDAAYDLKKQYGTEINDLISVQAAGEIAHRQLVA